MTPFDIPSSRLAELNPGDLRELVARLCESERERTGGHRNDVHWGGAQTAPDGGLDVVVEAISSFAPTPCVPRAQTGLQVKKSDLERAEITREMRPGGALRKSISSLAARSGAYLIVSVGTDCSHAMRQDRCAAMREALSDCPDADKLVTDFVSRHELARWVSGHPSVSLWLRKRLDLPLLSGWQGYQTWTAGPEDGQLICARGLKIHLPGMEASEDIPTALAAIRTLVRDDARAVRIAGLSGVGKSRLVQALFEETGEDTPLPKSWAIYADAGQDPSPAPMEMLEYLIGFEKLAVLIIDNCPPETHRHLAERLAKSSGPVRLITVEYDVRSDRPEETKVVRIEAEGSDIAEILILRRHPTISQIDAHRLADLAQGNARLALALAAAAPETGSLSAFEDDWLFQRLFWQRDEKDEDLLRSAEALSLVYSFDAEGLEHPHELAFLAELSGTTRQTLARHASKLVERGIAQARGRWRAVLPHALANRMAARALKSIPWRDLSTNFAAPEAARLRRSFARRLAYLHDLPEARWIAESWLDDGGPLDPAGWYERYDFELLERISPLIPDIVLGKLDSLIQKSSARGWLKYDFGKLSRLIARLAREEAHFDEACRRLVDLSIMAGDDKPSNAENLLGELFGLRYSYTLAKTDQRIGVAKETLYAANPRVRLQGLTMLRGAFSVHWSASLATWSEARPQAFGWEPRLEEVVTWYRSWITLAAELALNGPEDLRAQIRLILAQAIRNIWGPLPSVRREIEEIAVRLQQDGSWVEAWNQLKGLRSLERRARPTEDKVDHVRLNGLIDALEPKTTTDRLKAILRSKGYWEEEPESSEPPDYQAIEHQHRALLRDLGRELAGQPDLITAIGAELFTAQHHNPAEIGTGLGEATNDPEAVWQRLRAVFLSADKGVRHPAILSGFLSSIDEKLPDLAEAIRIECAADVSLRQYYWALVPRKILSELEFARLCTVASDPEVYAPRFGWRIWDEEGRLADDRKVDLLKAMRRGQHGQAAVLDALGMLRHVEADKPRDWPEPLREIAIDVIVGILTGPEPGLPSGLDGSMADLLEKCLLSEDDENAHRLVDALVSHADRRHGSIYDVERTAAALASRTPIYFLDRAFPREGRGMLLDRNANLDVPCLREVPPATLVQWCQLGGPERWIAIADAITPFGPEEDATAIDAPPNLSDQALALINAAPDPDAIVSAFMRQTEGAAYSGSYASVLEGRLARFEALKAHPKHEVRNAITAACEELRVSIYRVKADEARRAKDRDVSFE